MNAVEQKSASGRAHSLPAEGRKGCVSIVTRTRVRPVFLARAVESVLSQTHADWEHIIVNDGGDAAALDAFLAPYAARYAGRLVVIHLPQNRGMQGAANAALDRATGEFAAIHDDDDAWQPGFLSACVAFLDEKGPESAYQGVVTHTVRVLEDVAADGRIAEVSRAPYQPMDEVNLFRLGFENPFPPIAFVYRRAVHSVIGFFDERCSYAADLDFNFRFLAKWEIGVIRRPLAEYHWRRETADAGLRNTVTAEAPVHGRLLNEWLNGILRADAAKEPASLGLAMNLSRYAVGTRAAVDALAAQLAQGSEERADLRERLASIAKGDAALRANFEMRGADLKEHLTSLSDALSGDAISRLSDLKAHLSSLSDEAARTKDILLARSEELKALVGDSDRRLSEDLSTRLAGLLERFAGLSGAVESAQALVNARQEDLKQHLTSLSDALSGDAIVRLADLKEHFASLSWHVESPDGALSRRIDEVRGDLAGRTDTLRVQLAAFATRMDSLLAQLASADGDRGAKLEDALARVVSSTESAAGSLDGIGARLETLESSLSGDLPARLSELRALLATLSSGLEKHAANTATLAQRLETGLSKIDASLLSLAGSLEAAAAARQEELKTILVGLTRTLSDEALVRFEKMAAELGAVAAGVRAVPAGFAEMRERQDAAAAALRESLSAAFDAAEKEARLRQRFLEEHLAASDAETATLRSELALLKGEIAAWRAEEAARTRGWGIGPFRISWKKRR